MNMAEGPSEKLHAACDECRMRKLKCSGGSPKCSRCVRENITCFYSPQKQMGRPRKRRREDGSGDSISDLPLESPLGSNPDGLAPPGIGNFIISSQDLPEISTYGDFQANGDMQNAFMSSLYENPPFGHQGETSNTDFNLDPTIDPSLWNAQPNLLRDTSAEATPEQPTENTKTPCTCLSIMYLTLNDLHMMNTFSFPASVPALRAALHTATALIECERCPLDIFTAISNVQSLSALLSAIAERFHRVFQNIDVEADRLKVVGEKKIFRVGDTDPALQHLHTGAADCPMGFNVPLEADQWRILAKQALKTEIVGGGSNKKPLITLVEQTEQRQRKWHSDSGPQVAERMRVFGVENCHDHGDAMCLRMLAKIRAMVKAMKLEDDA